MGSTVSGTGTESLYFKDWGDLELKEPNLPKQLLLNSLEN